MIEEAMDALDDVVRSEKALYIGTSAMFAWQFQKALHVAEAHRWTRFVSMQNRLNLVYREEERKMLPLCREEGIGAPRIAPSHPDGWCVTGQWNAPLALKPTRSP